MNERIKELAEQAGFFVLSDDKIYIPTTSEEITDCQIKFAELIVLEMCNVLDKAQWDKGEDWVCADGTRIIPQVKDHFGVE